MIRRLRKEHGKVRQSRNGEDQCKLQAFGEAPSGGRVYDQEEVYASRNVIEQLGCLVKQMILMPAINTSVI